MDKPQTLNPSQAAERLSLPDGPWKEHWQDSEPFREENPFYLQPGYLEEACSFLRMDAEVSGVILAAARQFGQNPAWQRFLCHGRHVLRDAERYGYREFMALPAEAGDDGFCYVIAFLSALPEIREMHARRGVPEEITVATLADLERWIRIYRQWYGRWGFGERNWLFHPFRGNLFQLGRLQFLLDRFEDDMHLFRSPESGELRLLAPDLARFRPDGQFDGTNGIRAENPETAYFRETTEAFLGTLISPQSTVTGRQVSLGKQDWRKVLRKGDPALSFHIPASGPMDPGECRESFRRALDFFSRHFPDRPFRAFFSHSWLYDPQLADYLPEQSNIIRFQRMFYLYPLPQTDDRQIFERVFSRTFSFSEMPTPKTTLQKAVLEHVRRGGHWRTSGALLLPEDASTEPDRRNQIPK